MHQVRGALLGPAQRLWPLRQPRVHQEAPRHHRLLGSSAGGGSPAGRVRCAADVASRAASRAAGLRPAASRPGCAASATPGAPAAPGAVRAARADLLRRSCRRNEAAEQYQQALALAPTRPEREHVADLVAGLVDHA